MKKLIISAALGLMVPLMSFGQSTLGPGVMGTSLTVPNLPHNFSSDSWNCLLYTSNAADERSSVDLGVVVSIKKKIVEMCKRTATE